MFLPKSVLVLAFLASTHLGATLSFNCYDLELYNQLGVVNYVKRRTKNRQNSLAVP